MFYDEIDDDFVNPLSLSLQTHYEQSDIYKSGTVEEHTAVYIFVHTKVIVVPFTAIITTHNSYTFSSAFDIHTVLFK